jgi:hypothetical protein
VCKYVNCLFKDSNIFRPISLLQGYSKLMWNCLCPWLNRTPRIRTAEVNWRFRNSLTLILDGCSGCFVCVRTGRAASEQTETSAKDGFRSEDVMLLIPATANSYDIRGTETRSTGCILVWHKLWLQIYRVPQKSRDNRGSMLSAKRQVFFCSTLYT